MKLIPFNVVIPESEKNRNLPNELARESEGILAYLICGALDWQRDGLAEPHHVRYATDEYRSEMDVLARFMAECCVEYPDASVVSSVLYKEWEEWRERNGERALSQTNFSLKIKERGYKKGRVTGGTNKGKMAWHGLGLATDDTDFSTDPDPPINPSPSEHPFTPFTTGRFRP
jgi:putative DNA primase/helicase